MIDPSVPAPDARAAAAVRPTDRHRAPLTLSDLGREVAAVLDLDELLAKIPT